MLSKDIYFGAIKPFDLQTTDLFPVLIEEENDELFIKSFDSQNLDSLYQDVDKNGFTYGKDLYCANSENKHITLFDTFPKNTNYSYRTSTQLLCKRYAIETSNTNNECHLTKKTNIKSFRYYSDSIDELFVNNTISDNSSEFSSILKVEVAPKSVIPIGKIYINEYKTIANMSLEFGSRWEMHKKQNYEINAINYLSLSFNKSLKLNQIHSLAKKIDAAFYILTGNKNGFRFLSLKTHKGNEYDYYFKEQKQKNSFHFLALKDDCPSYLLKLLTYILNADDDIANAISPFINFNKSSALLDVSFSEYYRALEYMHKQENGNYSEKLILNFYIADYPKIKKYYYKNVTTKILEENLRNLRNYFVHYGYYIKYLPIPTERIKNPRRKVKINHAFLYKAQKFLKTLSYAKLLDVCGIDFDENDLIRTIK